jgi:signal transduction histidine kinase
VTGVQVLLGAWAMLGAISVVTVVVRRSVVARSEAIARACHELRGPLTALRLGLELAARTGDGVSAAQLRALDLELGRAALALDDLSAAGSLLPWWRRLRLSPGPRAGRLLPRPRVMGARARCPRGELWEAVSVSELLADSAQAWRPAAAAAGARLDVRWSGAPARVNAERLRLAQATGNLLANAIEHGGGAIELRGRAVGGTVRIDVIDDGPGLPAPVAELARRPRGGRGVRGRGLAIASSIARDHGGRLAGAPSERGARLVLELPVAAGPAAAGDQDAGPRPTG